MSANTGILFIGSFAILLLSSCVDNSRKSIVETPQYKSGYDAAVEDSLISKLRVELLDRNWIENQDIIKLITIDSSRKIHQIICSRISPSGHEKILNTWMYYGQEFLIFDSINKTEILIYPQLTKEDRDKLQKFNPVSP